MIGVPASTLPLERDPAADRQHGRATGTDNASGSRFAPKPDRLVQTESIAGNPAASHSGEAAENQLDGTSCAVKRNNPLTIAVNGLEKSGRQDRY
jgi:hypothetical protein